MSGKDTGIFESLCVEFSIASRMALKPLHIPEDATFQMNSSEYFLWSFEIFIFDSASGCKEQRSYDKLQSDLASWRLIFIRIGNDKPFNKDALCFQVSRHGQDTKSFSEEQKWWSDRFVTVVLPLQVIYSNPLHIRGTDSDLRYPADEIKCTQSKVELWKSRYIEIETLLSSVYILLRVRDNSLCRWLQEKIEFYNLLFY